MPIFFFLRKLYKIVQFCFKKLHKLKIKLIECIILKVFLPVRLTSRNQSRIDV